MFCAREQIMWPTLAVRLFDNGRYAIKYTIILQIPQLTFIFLFCSLLLSLSTSLHFEPATEQRLTTAIDSRHLFHLRQMIWQKNPAHSAYSTTQHCCCFPFHVIFMYLIFFIFRSLSLSLFTFDLNEFNSSQ